MTETRLGTTARGALLSSCLWAILCMGAAESAACPDEPAHAGGGPGNYRIHSGNGVVRFPFDLYRGDVRFVGEINGREVRMLIDNGIVWDQILFFGSPIVDSLKLNYDGEIEVGGGGEGERVRSRTASGITICFPGVEFIDQTAVVTPYEPGKPNPWVGAEGQVSGTFFRHFVVEFDFDAMMLTLIEPERFRYRGKGAEIPMTPLPNGGWSIPVTLVLENGRRVSLDVMMDLGLDDQFEISTTGEHRIPAPSKFLPGSLGFGIQGETLGRFGRIKSVEIGGYRLANVLAGFIDEKHTGTIMHEVMIGLGLLSRFNFTYDYPHHRMFLEPNRRFRDPFEHDMSGLEMRRSGGDHLDVLRVQPNSPAERAGIRPGDWIIRIDDRAAVDYDVWELLPYLRREGAIVRLSVKRNGENERIVTITLHPLL
jgi:hypothetical protein